MNIFCKCCSKCGGRIVSIDLYPTSYEDSQKLKNEELHEVKLNICRECKHPVDMTLITSITEARKIILERTKNDAPFTVDDWRNMP